MEVVFKVSKLLLVVVLIAIVPKLSQAQLNFIPQDRCPLDWRFDLVVAVDPFEFKNIDEDPAMTLLFRDERRGTEGSYDAQNKIFSFSDLEYGSYTAIFEYVEGCSIQQNFEHYLPSINNRPEPDLEFFQANPLGSCADYSLRARVPNGLEVASQYISISGDGGFSNLFGTKIIENVSVVSKPLREWQAANREYAYSYISGCTGARRVITIPCIAEGDVKLDQFTKASSCEANDGSIEIRFVEICATGGEARKELRDRMGNVMTPTETSGRTTYNGLRAQLYDLYVVGGEGCEKLIKSYDLEDQYSFSILADAIGSCVGASNGSISFDMYADGNPITATLNGEPLPLTRDVGGGYTTQVRNLPAGTYLGTATSGACSQGFSVTVPAPTTGQGSLRLQINDDVEYLCSAEGGTASAAKANLYVVGGMPPLKITWSDGKYEGIAERPFQQPGNYSIRVEDHCGQIRSGEIDVVDFSSPLKLDVDYVDDEGKCLAFPRVSLSADQIGCSRFAKLNKVATGSGLDELYLSPGTHTVYVSFYDAPCVNATTIVVGSVTPDIAVYGVCGDNSDGRAEFRLRGIPGTQPSLTVDGKSVALRTEGDYLLGAIQNLAQENHAYSINYGGCRVEDHFYVAANGLQREFNGYDEDNDICTY